MKKYDYDFPTSCSWMCPPWILACWDRHPGVQCFGRGECGLSTLYRNSTRPHRVRFVQGRCLRQAATRWKPSPVKKKLKKNKKNKKNGNPHQRVQSVRPSVNADRRTRCRQTHDQRLLLLVARCFLNRNPLATIAHLEMTVGTRNKQWTLNPVAISRIQNHVDEVLCPNKRALVG